MKCAGETQESQVVEEIVPADSNVGDFGEGTLELEEKLSKSLHEPEPASESEATTESETVSPETPVAAAPTASNVPLFDINGKLSVKAGEPLSAEHIKELERGWLREADYTQKTQQVAEQREAAQYVLEQQDRIQQDPRVLREFFEDKHILSAFSPQEMLNYGLAAGQVPVEVWNQFCDWYKESGLAPQGQVQPKADPYLQQFGEINKRIETVARTQQQIMADRQRQEQMAVEARQSEAKNEAFRKLDAQVLDAMKKYPDIEKNDLLVKMAASDGTKSVEAIAKAMHDREAEKQAKWIKEKQQTKQNSPRTVKGQPVNIVQRMPKTWDEANDAIARFR